jgi:hypothetical protein
MTRDGIYPEIERFSAKCGESSLGTMVERAARYAEEHADPYRRIESIAKVGEQLRLLDLTDADTRAAIASAASAKELYEGAFAKAY